MAGFPTGGVLLSDVRVTFVDPRTRCVVATVDGVQKVHPVAQNLAVAFAGSVVAGFTLVEDLARSLSGIEPGHVWSPAPFANQWQRRLRGIWGQLPRNVRDAGCKLLLVGARPATGTPFALAHSDAYRFAAPDFELVRLPRGQATSIGSGAEVAAYRDMIETFADEWHELAQFALQPFPGGPGGPMSVVLGELIRDNPELTVSTQLVFCLVGARATTVHTVTSPRPELTTPPLADTLSDFHELCRRHSLAAAAARGEGARRAGRSLPMPAVPDVER